jgi:hypothetical protein
MCNQDRNDVDVSGKQATSYRRKASGVVADPIDGADGTGLAIIIVWV